MSIIYCCFLSQVTLALSPREVKIVKCNGNNLQRKKKHDVYALQPDYLSQSIVVIGVCLFLPSRASLSGWPLMLILARKAIKASTANYSFNVLILFYSTLDLFFFQMNSPMIVIVNIVFIVA